MGADNLALLMLRDCQDFRELFLAGPTEIIVLGHDYLPIENSARENPSRTRTWRQAAPSAKISPEAKVREMRLIGVEYEAAMRGRTRELVFSVTLLGFASGIAIRARGAAQVPATE